MYISCYITYMPPTPNPAPSPSPVCGRSSLQTRTVRAAPFPPGPNLPMSSQP